MAHQIENNQFAYKGEAAWHGLGVAVSADATGEMMLQAAGLAFRVQRRALAMRTTKLGDPTMLTAELDGFRAIVRSDNNHVFQVASDRYQPVQNIEVVNFFREFCEAGHATVETVGALRDGAVIWALAKLNGGSSLNIMGVDRMEARILLATSHDGSLKSIAKKVNTRVVCGNTMTLALSENGQQWTLKHSSKFGEAQQKQAKALMGIAIEDAIRVNELAAELAKVTIDESGWMDFMGKLLGAENVLDAELQLTRLASDIQESTMTSPGSNLVSAKGTLWGAVNGVTHYVDHVGRSRSDSNRLFSAWFGDGERMKNSAVRVAAEMAGVSI